MLKLFKPNKDVRSSLARIYLGISFLAISLFAGILGSSSALASTQSEQLLLAAVSGNAQHLKPTIRVIGEAERQRRPEVYPENGPLKLKSDNVVEVEALPDDVWWKLRVRFELESVYARDTEKWLRWYQRNPHHLKVVLKRARPYIRHILQEVDKRDMPAEIALLPAVESGFDPFAYSPGGAAGLWQVIRRTGDHLGLGSDWWYDPRRDLIQSTTAALNYLEYLYRRFGSWSLALAAYNSGEGNVSIAMKKNRKVGKGTKFNDLRLPNETKDYVPKLLALVKIISEPWEYPDLQPPRLADEPYFAVVKMPGQVDMAHVANLAAIDFKTLQNLNPGFNRWATSPKGPHRLLVPASKAEKLRKAIAGLKAKDLVRWIRHKVTEGDNLGYIAQLYKTRVAVLRDVNQLKNDHLRIGQHLMIPVGATKMNQRPAGLARMHDSRVLTKKGREKVYYTTRTGDSFWKVAKLFNVEIEQIALWNDLSKSKPLPRKKKLVIWQSKNSKLDLRYTVKQNESLWLLAKRYEVSIADLRRWNGLGKKSVLRAGDKLWLRKPITSAVKRPSKQNSNAKLRTVHYSVRSGDSLDAISKKFGVSVAQLCAWNDISPKRYLQPGQALRIRVDVQNLPHS